MTPQEQRIAIAEACGWKQDTTLPEADFDRWSGPSGVHYFSCPDYLSDINAMHEAEKILHRVMRSQFIDYLAQQTGIDYFSLAHATAAQRAEAFLRTLGKWKANQ